MSINDSEKLSLTDIYDLAFNVFIKNGCNKKNAEPIIDNSSPAIISVNGNFGFTPYALEKGLPILASVSEKLGIAIMKITNTFHFAALWPETEFLANRGLVGIACTAAKPMVAPSGGKKAFFGTNPISFAWPRTGKPPVVFDMATSRLAMGDVQIAARDGHQLPEGTGLGPDGNASNDPKELADAFNIFGYFDSFQTSSSFDFGIESGFKTDDAVYKLFEAAFEIVNSGV